MTSTLITNARIVNEGREFEADLRIEGERIALILSLIHILTLPTKRIV